MHSTVVVSIKTITLIAIRRLGKILADKVISLHLFLKCINKLSFQNIISTASV